MATRRLKMKRIKELLELLRRDNGVSRKINGVLRRDNGVLRKRNGVLRRDNGVLRKRNGVLRRDDGVSRKKFWGWTYASGRAPAPDRHTGGQFR